MERSDLIDDMTRRGMLRRAGIAAGMLALPGIFAACGGDDDSSATGGSSSGGGEPGEDPELTKLLDAIESDTVIVATYGGTTEAARKKAFWDPFTKRTGCKVVTPDVTGTLGDDQLSGKIKARWDAYHNSAFQTLYSKNEGKKPLPEVPIQEDLVPESVRPYMWQSFLLGYVTGGLKGTFDTTPGHPSDFFDTKKFPGKRAFPTSFYIDGVKEYALLADGVSPDELYPLDIERANAKIASIWDDLVFYEAYPQIQTFLTSKTVSMAWCPSGILAAMPAKGFEVDIVWELAVTSWNNETIIPDAPHMDAVKALAAWCIDPKRQAVFCEMTNYGPSTQAALDALPEKVKQNVPNAPGRNTVPLNDEYYAENYDMLYADHEKLFKSQG
jgi:putative spermidine/putrescine transport system substrate-binding protein